MKTLILIIGIFFNFNLLFSQEKIDLEFFEYYKKSFYLDGDFLKYDLGIGEVITDTIKYEMLKNKIVRFPKRCDFTLDDYTDYSYCLTGNELESGFLLSNFYISNDEEKTEDIFDIFIKKIEKDINEENYQIFSYEKINCKIFSFKRFKDLDVYDPNTLELIDTIHIEKNVYILILTMYG